MRIAVRADIVGANRYLQALSANQVPVPMSYAIYQVAFHGMKALRDEMRQQLDRPTPFVVRQTYYTKSTKRDLRAELGAVREDPIGKSRIGMAELLQQQFAGGTRVQTGFERAMGRAGFITSNERLVAGNDFPRNAYGNISQGVYQKVLSQLQAQFDPAQNATKSKRSKAKRKVQGYFWSYGDYLPRGVYQRKARSILPVFIVVKTAHYKRVISIETVVQRVIDKLGFL